MIEEYHTLDWYMVHVRMYIATIWAVVLLPCLAIINHQSSIINAQEIPTVGRPTANFYNAQGNRVRVEWRLDRTTVPEDEDIVATLVVTGATNPREVIRPDLGKLEPFDVAVHHSRDERSDSGGRYERGPVHVPIAAAKPVGRFVPDASIPLLQPGQPRGEEVPAHNGEVRGEITVTAPRPRTEPPPLPMGEPEWLLAYRPQPVSLSSPAFSGVWSWIAIGLVGPLAALGWYVAWQRVYPDAARLARMRRSRAARRATEAIRRADRMPDPPAAIATAVLGYLRALPAVAGRGHAGRDRRGARRTRSTIRRE